MRAATGVSGRESPRPYKFPGIRPTNSRGRALRIAVAFGVRALTRRTECRREGGRGFPGEESPQLYRLSGRRFPDSTRETQLGSRGLDEGSPLPGARAFLGRYHGAGAFGYFHLETALVHPRVAARHTASNLEPPFNRQRRLQGRGVGLAWDIPRGISQSPPGPLLGKQEIGSSLREANFREIASSDGICDEALAAAPRGTPLGAATISHAYFLLGTIEGCRRAADPRAGDSTNHHMNTRPGLAPQADGAGEGWVSGASIAIGGDIRHSLGRFGGNLANIRGLGDAAIVVDRISSGAAAPAAAIAASEETLTCRHPGEPIPRGAIRDRGGSPPSQGIPFMHGSRPYGGGRRSDPSSGGEVGVRHLDHVRPSGGI